LNATGNVKFKSELSGVYHVEKHYETEFPQSERKTGKTDVENYLNSASTTINEPTRPPSIGVDQNGNRIIKFERDIIEDGEVRTGLAIVKVSPDGEMSLATYHFPGGDKK
jgi:hypothetical protein